MRKGFGLFETLSFNIKIEKIAEIKNANENKINEK
jgi:hypothetical protein